MRLYIFSTQAEINSIFHDHFSEKGYLCVTFNGFEEFFKSLQQSSAAPELIILDYLLYNHEIFNIYDYLKNKGCNYPCIFYNDPCLTRSSRLLHWQAQINILQNLNNSIDLKKLEPILSDLQTLVENKQIAPSIYLMQEPLPLPKEFLNPKITLEYIKQFEEDGLEDFKIRNNLPESLFYLLKLMQQNEAIKLNIQDIQKLYKKDNKDISESSLYVMLSRLRNIIIADKNKKFIISKEGEYYNFIKFIHLDD